MRTWEIRTGEMRPLSVKANGRRCLVLFKNRLHKKIPKSDIDKTVEDLLDFGTANV